MQITPLTNNEKGWQEYVREASGSTVYHLLEWIDVLKETYNYKSAHLMAEDDNGVVCGVLPLFQVKSALTGNRLVSLPFSYLGGPVASSDDVLEKLIREAEEISSRLGCTYLELKMQHELPKKTIRNLGLSKSKYHIRSLLRLTNSQDIWKKLPKGSIKSAVNKASRAGVKVLNADSLDDVRVFYELEVKTRKKHGVPVPSSKFFERIWTGMASKGLAKLLFAEYDRKIIAGIMLFTFKDTILYAYSVSDDKYQEYRPTNLLLWKAIEEGCNNNYDFFDFGRTSPDNRGLLGFKMRWSTENYELPYYYNPKAPNRTSSHRGGLKYRLMTGFWKKVPTSVSKLVGPHILKHFG